MSGTIFDPERVTTTQDFTPNGLAFHSGSGKGFVYVQATGPSRSERFAPSSAPVKPMNWTPPTRHPTTACSWEWRKLPLPTIAGDGFRSSESVTPSR